MTPYTDVFVLPVPRAKVEAYRKMAEDAIHISSVPPVPGRRE